MKADRNSGMSALGPEDAKVDSGRRWVNTILGAGVVATVASFIYPAIRYVIPPPVSEASNLSVVAAKVGELKENAAKVFKFGSTPAILVRTPDGNYRAFTAVCTHLGCTVQYRSDLHEIWCPCHNGKYNLQGRNTSGPPPRPLAQYQVHIQGGDVVVVRNT
ncbi:MAG TPA: Rieske (2Fe-2S) protein [Terriglobia bacterium]|nr:Rieske (2Fe-2S) protein [Terriglobia bacterium]